MNSGKFVFPQVMEYFPRWVFNDAVTEYNGDYRIYDEVRDCGGCVIGAFGPAVMGWMNDAFSMSISFAALSIFALFGALLLFGARIFTFP